MANILVTTMSFDAERGGGSVRIAYDLAIGLAHRGHKITVVCEDLYECGKENVNINGITVLRYQLTHSLGTTFLRHQAHITAVKKLLNKYIVKAPDVVHGHHILQYNAALDLFQNNSRSCYTIHSPAVEELKIAWSAYGIKGKIKTLLGLPVVRQIEKDSFQRSSALTVLSEYTSSLITQHYGNAIAQKIIKIPGWVDTKHFHPLSSDETNATRQQLKWPQGRPVIFVLRRLESRMGLDNLLKSLALVKSRGFRPFTAIGGSGSMLRYLVKLRDSLGLQDDVMFMGFVPAAQLPQAYGSCDASVVPSAQLECFGIIALESLACGKYTLVTPVGALPEVMRDFQPGWIARDATVESIADLIITFLDKKLIINSYDSIKSVLEQKYSYNSALLAYERFLIGN